MKGSLVWIGILFIAVLGCAKKEHLQTDAPPAMSVEHVTGPKQGVPFCGQVFPPDAEVVICEDRSVESVEPLGRLLRVRALDISGTGVTDISPLAKLNYLKILWISEANIPSERLVLLRESLPDLEIFVLLTCDSKAAME